MEYRKGFEDELQAFKERIRRRAKEKLEAAMAEAEEEERKLRLGPGGLDPVEVFESLPQVRPYKYVLVMAHFFFFQTWLITTSLMAHWVDTIRWHRVLMSKTYKDSLDLNHISQQPS